MAKIKPSRWVSASPKRRKIKSDVWLIRTPGTSKSDTFLACIRLGQTANRACEKGRNPRAALAKALSAAAGQVHRRKGVFAGVGRKRRRR